MASPTAGQWLLPEGNAEAELLRGFLQLHADCRWRSLGMECGEQLRMLDGRRTSMAAPRWETASGGYRALASAPGFRPTGCCTSEYTSESTRPVSGKCGEVDYTGKRTTQHEPTTASPPTGDKAKPAASTVGR